jgi:hypothetical protein
VYARHRSPAIQFISSELFIHINRAYDRMRDAAVASGSAIAPGPALLPHRGWMAEFDDIGAQAPAPVRPTPPPPPPPATKRAVPPPVPPGAKSRTAPQVALTHEGLFGDEATPRPEVAAAAPEPPAADTAAQADVPAAQLVIDARALIADGEHSKARELLVAVLRREPRNRTARSLYHLCSAEILLAAGKAVEATTQLEVAAAHDASCEEVRAALARARQDPAKKGGLFRRLFR